MEKFLQIFKIQTVAVLLLTLFFATDSFAQVSTLQNWSNLYNNSGNPGTLSFPVSTGTNSNRLLVVAIASSRTDIGSRSVSVTYGGQTLTLAAGNMTSTGFRQHTAFYYLRETGLDAATSSDLSITISDGTTRVNTVWAAVFDYVDQTSTFQHNNSGQSNGTANQGNSLSFSSDLTIGSNNQAVYIVTTYRYDNTNPRNINSYPSNFTMVDERTSNNTDGIRSGIANRSIPTSATTSNGQVNISGNNNNGTRISITGVSIIGCTVPTVNVGNALAAICQGGTSAPLGGSIGGSATGATWTSSAGGTFLPNATTLNATWTPPTGYSGTATLTLTTSGGSCGTVSASKTQVVNPIPTAVTATPSVTSVCYDGSVGLTSGAISNSTFLINENFDSPTNNWTTTNTSTGGTPANAAWTLRGNGYTFNVDGTNYTLNSNDNSQLYLSNSFAQGDGTTNTTLVSPAFSTVGLSTGSLKFYHYYKRFNEVTPQGGFVEVSTDGTNYTSLISYQATTGSGNNFQEVTLNLAAYLNQPTVYVRFRYNVAYDDFWAIDNVSVTGTPIPATFAWTSTPAGFTSAVQNPTATNQTVDRTYTVTATNNYGCTASATTASVAIAANTWVGTTSSAWDVATNWSCGVVPNANHNVSIPINTPNATNLNVDYTLPLGKTLTISGTGALTIAPQSVLTIAGSANFGNRPVTVKSDATGDGMIGQVSGSLTNATNVTVERYIPSGKRAFRFLTPGVTTTDYISNNWQLATHITGSTTGANGFDATTTGGPSMYTYNNTVASGTGWTAIPSTNATNLEAGLGYRLLIRGDRTPTLITSASVPNMNTAITLSAKGTVKTGTVVVNAASTPAINGTSNTTTNGFSLVGNPYVSAVDWNAVSRSGLTDVYYAWDPNMGTEAQRGRYVTYSASTGFNNLGNSGSSNIGRYIQSGQAFFVKNTTLGTAGTLTFDEDDKANNFASVFRNQQDMSISKLGLLVYEPNELALGSLPIDGAVALFGTDFTNAIEAGDVEKLESAGENLAIFSSNQKLAMSAMAPVVEDDELLLKTLRFAANKSYTFKIEPANFDATVAAYFVDQFLNTETAIDLTQDSFVTVTTTSDVLSFGEDRFKIVFGTQQLGNPDFDKVVSLYPNPSKLNEFNLNLPSWDDTVQVNMFNSLGQQIPVSIENGDGMSKRFRVNTNLSSGVYYIKVTQNGKETTKKWIYNN